MAFQLDESGVAIQNQLGSRFYSHFSRQEQITDKPLVVLIDSGSASASEIFSGVIQSYKRGWVLGETSFGKGSMQALYQDKKNEEGLSDFEKRLNQMRWSPNSQEKANSVMLLETIAYYRGGPGHTL